MVLLEVSLLPNIYNHRLEDDSLEKHHLFSFLTLKKRHCLSFFLVVKCAREQTPQASLMNLKKFQLFNSPSSIFLYFDCSSLEFSSLATYTWLSYCPYLFKTTSTVDTLWFTMKFPMVSFVYCRFLQYVHQILSLVIEKSYLPSFEIAISWFCCNKGFKFQLVEN